MSVKNILLLILFTGAYFEGIAQEIQNPKESKAGELLQELAENSCNCIDSVETDNRPKEEIIKEISRCIDEQAGAYQVGAKLTNLDDKVKNAKETEGTKQVEIAVNLDKESDEYQAYYYTMERYLMDHCASLKIKMAVRDEQHDKSISEDSKAMDFYTQGIAATEKKDYQKAIDYYKKALAIDTQFAFAWDNLGICYRKLGDYDRAIDAYEHSLAIDPEGLTPLQNLAVAYRFKKKYRKAIAAYERLAQLDENNPEVYFGIGQTYAVFLNDYEQGLKNMCKAYNLYVKQNSPYRSDAEQIISYIYLEMKKQGKEKRFNEILESFHITPEK